MVVNFIWEFLYGIFVGNISDHYCSPRVILNIVRKDKIKTCIVETLVVVTIIICLKVVVFCLVVGCIRVQISRTGITFRKRLIDWKSLPKLVAFTIKYLLNLWLLLLFIIIPLAVYSFCFDFAQDRI